MFLASILFNSMYVTFNILIKISRYGCEGSHLRSNIRGVIIDYVKLKITSKLELWVVVICCICSCVGYPLNMHYSHAMWPKGGLLHGMLPHIYKHSLVNIT